MPTVSQTKGHMVGEATCDEEASEKEEHRAPLCQGPLRKIKMVAK